MPTDQVDAVIRDWRTAGLDEVESALATYADKLTRTPGAVRETDLAPLRAVGLTDEQILNAASACSYFNFINRMADGLGVDLEPEMRGLRPPWDDDTLTSPDRH